MEVVFFAGYIVTSVVIEERDRLLKDLQNEYERKYKSLTDDTLKEELKEKAQEAKAEIEGIHVHSVLDEPKFHKYSMKYGSMFEARIGAEALYDILASVKLPELAKDLL